MDDDEDFIADVADDGSAVAGVVVVVVVDDVDDVPAGDASSSLDATTVLLGFVVVDVTSTFFVRNVSTPPNDAAVVDVVDAVAADAVAEVCDVCDAATDTGALRIGLISSSSSSSPAKTAAFDIG